METLLASKLLAGTEAPAEEVVPLAQQSVQVVLEIHHQQALLKEVMVAQVALIALDTLITAAEAVVVAQGL